MHLAGATYDEVIRTFRWEVPARFNIAHAICDRHAAATPLATALIFETETDGAKHGGTPERSTTSISFQSLLWSANQLANALNQHGVGIGDVVAIHLPQCPESPISHIAVQKLGAISLPMFNLFGPDAVRYRLVDSRAKVLITTADGFARLSGSLDGIATLNHVHVIGSDDWRRIGEQSQCFATADTHADDPALLMYTSGTTGNPKGVLHAARVLLGHLPGVMMPHELFPQPGDRFWTPADWAWAGGLLDVLWPALYFGVPVVGSRRAKFDAEWAFEFMARHEVRNAFIPPTALRLMRQLPPLPSRAKPALRSIGTGGETLGADMIAWGRATFGLTINEFYGQTECNLVVSNCAGLFPVRAGSMGRAVPGHIVEIVDDSGRVLPVGTPGIVAVQCPDPVMFIEYWGRPDATAEKLRRADDGDTWCLLGDIATKDADGYFWYQGRDDDLINSAGYRIGPDEIEQSLLQHEAVQAAGVIGAPDPLRGEIVVAFVVPRAGHVGSAELAVALQAFVKARLAAHEYPRRIVFVETLPTTITGKLRRVDLRRQYEASYPAPTVIHPTAINDTTNGTSA